MVLRVNGDASNSGHSHVGAFGGYFHRALLPGLAAVGRAEDACRVGSSCAREHEPGVRGVNGHRPDAGAAHSRIQQAPFLPAVLAAVQAFVRSSEHHAGTVRMVAQHSHQSVGVHPRVDAHTPPGLAAVGAAHDSLSNGTYQDCLHCGHDVTSGRLVDCGRGMSCRCLPRRREGKGRATSKAEGYESAAMTSSVSRTRTSRGST